MNDMLSTDVPMDFGLEGGVDLGFFESMDFNDDFDPRWELLFNNLENMQGIYD